MFDLIEPRTLFDIAVAFLAGGLGSFGVSSLKRHAEAKAELAKTVFEFARSNFDALKDHQGFITLNSLYVAAKQFPDRDAELRFLMDNLSKFGHVIGHYDVVIYSPAGGFVADSQLWGATRSELDGLKATVSPTLGRVTIRRG